LALWSDDYVKFQNYLEKGKNVMVQGFYKQNWKGDGFEFKVTSVYLLETAKTLLTKSIDINLHPAAIDESFISFIEKNMKKNPGKASIKFNIVEPIENVKISLYNNEKGFTMNDDMAEFLLNNGDVEVSVGLN